MLFRQTKNTHSLVKNFAEQKFQVQRNGEMGHFSDPGWHKIPELVRSIAGVQPPQRSRTWAIVRRSDDDALPALAGLYRSWPGRCPHPSRTVAIAGRSNYGAGPALATARRCPPVLNPLRIRYGPDLAAANRGGFRNDSRGRAKSGAEPGIQKWRPKDTISSVTETIILAKMYFNNNGHVSSKHAGMKKASREACKGLTTHYQSSFTHTRTHAGLDR